MDHSTTFPIEQLWNVLYVAGILTYGAYQYVKREKAHKVLIQSLLTGGDEIPATPTGETRPALWRILNILAIEIVLLAGIIWLVSVRSRILYAGEFTYYIALFFLVLFGLLMPVLIREVKRYRDYKAL
jgi:hypothetical protein